MVVSSKFKNNDLHKPVLAPQVVDSLRIIPDSVYVDATFGRGGHARLILDKLSKDGRLYVMDCDPEATHAAQLAFENDPRVVVLHSRFSNIQQQLQQCDPEIQVAGILADLGVSSPQLDSPERGFSFDKDGPLDMRMNTDEPESAFDLLKRASARELESILRNYGEEKFARRIARSIVEQRSKQPIESTHELAKLVAHSVPTREPGKHPATRTFQAIRIHINRELKELSSFLPQCIELLKKGGRLVVITFHSIEDRLVKKFMRNASIGAPGPEGVPFRQSEFRPTLSIVGRAMRPNAEEIRQNRRARSATLRVAERTGEVSCVH